MSFNQNSPERPAFSSLGQIKLIKHQTIGVKPSGKLDKRKLLTRPQSKAAVNDEASQGHQEKKGTTTSLGHQGKRVMRAQTCKNAHDAPQSLGKT